MKLTRTWKIVLAVVIVVLSVALGYLIWRVNNEGNLGPDDSDAGQSSWGTCWYCCSGSRPTCTQANVCLSGGWCCDANKGVYCSKSNSPYCSSSVNSQQCGDGVSIPKPTGGDMEGKSGAELCLDCGRPAPGDDEPVIGECSLGSQCADKVHCVWPEVAYCNHDNECVCNAGSDNDCDDNSPQCTPSCPAGYEPCSGGDCGSDTKQAECYADCAGCNNRYWVEITCKKTPINVCDGGSWISKPSGNLTYEGNVSFSAKAVDSDGIDPNSIIVKKDGTALPRCSGGSTVNCISLSEGSTETTISGTLSTATTKLDPGDYSISMDWKDKKGASSTTCALTTSFTILPPETNPDWDITKAVVEQCIDENTSNPKSELTYTITVRNTGDGEGRYTKIEDVLDTNVLDSFVQVSSITGNGVYSSGKILWDFTSSPITVSAGSTKVYTYKLIVDKDHFGTFANEVTLYPEGSDSIKATANITADCEIADEPEEPETPEVPQTGIFDSTLGRISVGIVLVIIGTLVYLAPNISLSVQIRNGKMYIRDKNINKIRERFEKKVENR